MYFILQTVLCFTFRGQCAGVFVRVSQSFCIVPAETCLLQRPKCTLTDSYRLLFQAISEASLCEELLLSESDFCFGVNR